jgi:hypothetical protein
MHLFRVIKAQKTKDNFILESKRTINLNIQNKILIFVRFSIPLWGYESSLINKNNVQTGY